MEHAAVVGALVASELGLLLKKADLGTRPAALKLDRCR
jgi:hypothetical protein